MKKSIFRSKKTGVQFGAIFATVVATLGLLLLVQVQSQTVSAHSSESAHLMSPDGVNQAPFATTITVDTSKDFTQSDIDNSGANLNKYTCGFTSGALFFPAPDAKCTLRRAILEASARPQSDRPILIRFNIPANDPNANLVESTWTIFLDQALPELKTDSIVNLNGQVTIDGETQPGIRPISDGPGMIINASDTGLQIYSTDNVIRNLAWQGVSEIAARNKANNNLFENLWMGLADDGNSLFFRDTNDFKRMAIGGLTLASNGNTVRNSTISGAFAKAINIDGGDDNLITNNFIGTRADGTIPVVSEASECNASFSYDPALWYGGWGLALSGSRNIISNNTILSMHIMRSANDTSPVAIEIFGADHQILNNRIGVDINGVDEGVCGHAMNITGHGHEITENVMAKTRVSFEDGEESAMFSRDSSPLFGQNTIRKNIVRDGPGKILIFAGNINSSLKFFEPARITKISGTTVEGEAETGFPCPNCTIDLYLDDTDELEEALAWLGTVTADANGKFAFEMSSPLLTGQGIRTMATTNASGVIGSFGPGTTSEASQLYAPLTGITITGATSGVIGTEYTFDIVANPADAGMTIDYTLIVTDVSSPITAQFGHFVNYKKTWTTAGSKTVKVTADNGLSSVTKSFQIVLTDPSVTPPSELDEFVYLPLVVK
jgi:hypothetical protein